MMDSIKLWITAGKLRIAERMTYRTEFIISLISTFVLEMIGPLITFVIYSNTDGFPGWTFYEVLLVQGVILAIRGFSFISFAGIVWNSNIKLKKGEFDLLLLKPRNILLTFICDSFDAEDIAKLLGGLAIMVYSIMHIANVSILGILSMIIFMILGVILYFSIALLASSFIFRFIRSFMVYEIIDLLELFGRNPKSIYPKWMQGILITIIPIFVLGIFPVRALLLDFEYSMAITAVCVFAILFISIKIWYSTIKKYSSAGG